MKSSTQLKEMCELSCLPVELLYYIAGFICNLSDLIQTNKYISSVVLPMHIRRTAAKRITMVLHCQLATRQNSVDVTYIRELSPGIYRCRDPVSDYDHFFVGLDTYQSFIREYSEFESGMFVDGIVHTEDATTRGMLSYERFGN
jgi:hypothetical protein